MRSLSFLKKVELSKLNLRSQKRPFRRNGLASHDCLPYENLEMRLKH